MRCPGIQKDVETPSPGHLTTVVSHVGVKSLEPIRRSGPARQEDTNLKLVSSKKGRWEFGGNKVFFFCGGGGERVFRPGELVL